MTGQGEPSPSDVAAVQAAAQQARGVWITPDGTARDLQQHQLGGTVLNLPPVPGAESKHTGPPPADGGAYAS